MYVHIFQTLMCFISSMFACRYKESQNVVSFKYNYFYYIIFIFLTTHVRTYIYNYRYIHIFKKTIPKFEKYSILYVCKKIALYTYLCM